MKWFFWVLAFTFCTLSADSAFAVCDAQKDEVKILSSALADCNEKYQGWIDWILNLPAEQCDKTERELHQAQLDLGMCLEFFYSYD